MTTKEIKAGRWLVSPARCSNHEEYIDSLYVFLRVDLGIIKNINGLRDHLAQVKAAHDGAFDITQRAPLEAFVTDGLPECGIVMNGGSPPAWLVGDVPVDFDEMRVELHGLRVWCDYTNAVRFVCYLRHGPGTVESENLSYLLETYGEVTP